MRDIALFLAKKQKELGVTLNEVQQRAVAQTEGSLLLLASPGSGKTTTIIMRIGYMIEELGVNPARIKAVTFSRASAHDMKQRFKRFFPELAPVDFSTIHSLAFQMVREHLWRKGVEYALIEGEVEEELEGGEPGSEGQSGIRTQISGGQQLPLHKRIILRRIYSELLHERLSDDQLEELSTYISYIKNKMIPRHSWNTVSCDVKEAPRILAQYEDFKQKGHSKLLLDFDDMLTLANEALEQDARLLSKYAGRYDYVLTDESQDTSLIQHAIIEKLARGHRNLCVVADDDQSIYSWRGAEPSYLLNFQQHYKDAVILYMEQNYRSSKNIVDAANRFIKMNTGRYPKNMFTANAEDHDIAFVKLPAFERQGSYLVQELRGMQKLSEAAVLYRNNASSIALMNAFDRAGIPFYMKDADNRFFSHWVVEDILNFMRMTFTDKRADILEAIHMKLNGYISKEQMSRLKQIQNSESVFDNLIQYVPLKDYQIPLIIETKDTLKEMRGMPPLPAIRVIRIRLGYEKALERMCERLGYQKDYLFSILNTLEDIAEELPTMESFAGRLKELEAALKASKARRGQNAVTFSTLHSAKGLEFDNVYMIDLMDGIIPSKEDRNGSGGGMEEAVRLFYVGMTRARSHLELITYEKRGDQKAEESPFVARMRRIVKPPQEKAEGYGAKPGEPPKPQKPARRKRNVRSGGVIVQEHKGAAPTNPNAIKRADELREGLAVMHSKFGQGRVVSMQAETIELQFGEAAKKLSLKACLELGLLERV